MAGHIASSSNLEWCTPPEILAAVRKSFPGEHIALDPCANTQGFVGADRTYSLEHKQDGLALPWDAPSVFVNPPFGVSYLNTQTFECITQKEYAQRVKDQTVAPSIWKKQTIADWVKKCQSAYIDYSRVKDDPDMKHNAIALIPASVDTKHWQDIVFQSAYAICFLRGRIHFYVNGKKGGPAPMACVAVAWGPCAAPAGEDPAFFDAFQPLGKIIVP